MRYILASLIGIPFLVFIFYMGDTNVISNPTLETFVLVMLGALYGIISDKIINGDK